jgi:ABC-type transport system involved in multi-copper enzyme maturation permease subunit
MQLAILSKELRLTLRRTDSFATAFALYSFLTMAIVGFWAARFAGAPVEFRELASRSIFQAFLEIAYIFFCFHSAFVAARLLVQEKERNTLQFLRIAPISGLSLMLQKLATPLAVEQLFLFGVLPMLSPIFLLGGLTAKEFILQFINLIVWVITSLSIGLCVSSRSQSSVKAVRRSFLILSFLMFGVPFLYAHLGNKGSTPWLGAVLGQQTEIVVTPSLQRWLASLSSILPLSPQWMTAAVDDEDTTITQASSTQVKAVNTLAGTVQSFGMNGQILWKPQPMLPPWSWVVPSMPVNPTYGSALRGSWSPQLERTDWLEYSILYKTFALAFFGGHLVAVSWVLHLLFQLTLFQFAVLGWRRMMLIEPITSDHRSLLSRPLHPMLPRREAFSLGWRAFYEQEAHLLFGGRGKAFQRLLLYGAAAVVILGAWIGGDLVIPLLFAATAGLIFFANFGLAPNAIRRERERDTSVLLLAAPVQPKIFLLGKWLFYLALSAKILVLGLLLTLAALITMKGGIRGWVFEILNLHVFYLAAALLPLLSLEGIAIGLRVRRKDKPFLFLLQVSFLVFGPLLAWLSVSLYGSLERAIGFRFIASWVPFAGFMALPWILIGFFACLFAKGFDLYGENAPSPGPWRKTVAAMLALYIVADFTYFRLVPPDFMRPGITFYFRCLLATLSASWVPWVWISRRPAVWWRERLAPSLE